MNQDVIMAPGKQLYVDNILGKASSTGVNILDTLTVGTVGANQNLVVNGSANPSSLSVSGTSTLGGYSTLNNNIYLQGGKQIYADNITSNSSTSGIHINKSNLVVHNDLGVLGNIINPTFTGTAHCAGTLTVDEIGRAHV